MQTSFLLAALKFCTKSDLKENYAFPYLSLDGTRLGLTTREIWSMHSHSGTVHFSKKIGTVWAAFATLHLKTTALDNGRHTIINKFQLYIVDKGMTQAPLGTLMCTRTLITLTEIRASTHCCSPRGEHESWRTENSLSCSSKWHPLSTRGAANNRSTVEPYPWDKPSTICCQIAKSFTRSSPDTHNMHDKKEEQLRNTVPKLCTAALHTKSQQLYHIYNALLFSPLRAASCLSFTLGNGSNAARLRG